MPQAHKVGTGFEMNLARKHITFAFIFLICYCGLHIEIKSLKLVWKWKSEGKGKVESMKEVMKLSLEYSLRKSESFKALCQIQTPTSQLVP